MRRVLVWGAGSVVALALLGFAVSYPYIQRLSNIGAGYVALQMCSCVEVSGRSFSDCLLDMLPEMDRIASLRVDRGAVSGVRAWIPLYADRTAWHHPPEACTLE